MLLSGASAETRAEARSSSLATGRRPTASCKGMLPFRAVNASRQLGFLQHLSSAGPLGSVPSPRISSLASDSLAMVAWVLLVPLVPLAACQQFEPLMLPEHRHEHDKAASKQHEHEKEAAPEPKPSKPSWWHRLWPFALEEARHEDEQPHGHHHRSVHQDSSSKNSQQDHWWDHLWPFELEEKHDEREHKDGEHREHDHKPDAVKDDSPATHWWDRLWPFGSSNAIELVAEDHSHEAKGHNSKDEGHWWDRLWPFALLSSACLGCQVLETFILQVKCVGDKGAEGVNDCR